jgi:light-regulated signal transduction histidine kinase (bacteriophytochrome)
MQAPIGIVLLSGENYLIELANECYVSLINCAEEDCVGRPYFEIAPEAVGSNLRETLDKVRLTGEPYSIHEREIIVHRANGEEIFYLNIIYKPVTEAQGSPGKIIAVVTNVTDTVLAKKNIEDIIEKRTLEIKNVNATLERSNKDLEQFAYIASHDLQEPLRKVKAFGDMLAKRYADILGQEGADMIRRMQSASERMQSLINDLLSYSRVASRPIDFEPIDLNIIIKEVLFDLESVIKTKEATINVEYFHPVLGDQLQLRQLFQNLISNSLKFSREGCPPLINITANLVIGIESGFDLPKKLNKKLFQLIEVNDNGIGFDQQYATKIFQLFQRLHGRSDYPGTGIGLSIVQKVVENHQGYISATGEEGGGTSFRILLPASSPST